jgi:ketosteroid isomerase-like protein
MTTPATPTPIAVVVARFVAGFNANDLDAVMAFFTEDAVYRPGDGNEHRGRAAIREAFRPQFEGAYGAMVFAVDDVLVDEASRKAAIRWICRHDIGGENGRGIPRLNRLLYRLMYGRRFSWYGMDVFHFDREGKIAAKMTYASYRRPRIRRDQPRDPEGVPNPLARRESRLTAAGDEKSTPNE